MARNEKMSHTGSGGSSFWTRIQDAGYNPVEGAENIAAGQRTPDEVFDDWMGSWGHRRNINASYENIGFGIAQDDDGDIYWCVVFGSKHFGYTVMIDYNSADYCPTGVDKRSKEKQERQKADES